jgi:glyoxylase-like metal-dependent hydrolase (beta-lactamase superfamily II)
MQLLPGLHQIPINYKNRPLKLYLIQGPDMNLLMDTGDASTPDADILPYFKSINFDPKNLTHVIATHPDLDHTGGLARIKQVAGPHTQFICGTADRAQVESPEGLVDLRYRAHYHHHQLGPDDKAREALIQRSGAYVPINATFTGGETLRVAHDQYLEILHLPGHSHGHLGVYLPWQNTAIIGDAVHGTANRFLDGKAAFACTYMYIDEYLGTIARLQAMNLTHLFSCHWPECNTNDEVNAFLTQSRDYCLSAEKAILETVQASGEKGLTLKEVCQQAKPRLGDWPADKDMETRSMAHGHLQHLVNVGHLSASDSIPIRYTPNPTWQGLA